MRTCTVESPQRGAVVSKGPTYAARDTAIGTQVSCCHSKGWRSRHYFHVIHNTNGMSQVVNGVHTTLPDYRPRLPLAAPRRRKSPISIGTPSFPCNCEHARFEFLRIGKPLHSQENGMRRSGLNSKVAHRHYITPQTLISLSMSRHHARARPYQPSNKLVSHQQLPQHCTHKTDCCQATKDTDAFSDAQNNVHRA
jgi:hypothetical protein